jgi:hypothetical protein
MTGSSTCRQLGGLCLSLLRLPVFQSQCRNSRKLAGIVRYQRQVVSKGDCGDLEIVRPDRFSPSLERTTDLGAFHRTGVIEREREKRRKKHVEPRVFTTRVGTRFSAVAQFVHDYGTENDVGDFRRLSGGDQTRLLLTKETKCRCSYPEERSFERKPLFEVDPRRNSDIEPATRSKKPSGQPFSSTGDPAATERPTGIGRGGCVSPACGPRFPAVTC